MDNNRSFEEVRSKRYPMMEASPHLLFMKKPTKSCDSYYWHYFQVLLPQLFSLVLDRCSYM